MCRKSRSQNDEVCVLPENAFPVAPDSAAGVSFASPGATNLVEVASIFVLLSFLAMSERPSRAEDVRRGR